MGKKDLWVMAPFVCKKGRGAEMKNHLHVLVQAVRQEHCCLFDDCLQDANNPDAFTFVEHWATEADFDAHVAGAAAKKWSDEAGHLIEVPVVINHFKSIWPD